MNDFITRLLPGEFIQALYWTLLHSLWQGLILVVLCGIAIQLTKKTTAAVRYNILTTLFFTFFLVSCFTFIYSYERVNTTALSFTAGGVENIVVHVAKARVEPGTVNNTQSSFFNDLLAGINKYSDIIITVWLVLVCFRCLQLILNVFRLERMRSAHTYDVPEFWQGRIQELSQKLNISRVTLRLSRLVKVPCVVGFFKPTILIPFSLLSGLTQAQVESILIHELAHIRRRDFYVNLLQGVVGVIYFFNPALIWVSGQIRKERENCCDDIVLQGTSDKATFIKALVAFQEYSLRTPSYAPALASAKKPLLARIERMINNNNKTLNPMEKLTLVSIVCILSLSLLSFSGANANNNKPAQTPMTSNNDTFPRAEGLQRGQSKLMMDKNGKHYKIVRMNGKVTEFYIDGKRVPDTELKNHMTLIDQLTAESAAIKVPEPPAPPVPGEPDEADKVAEEVKVADKPVKEKQSAGMPAPPSPQGMPGIASEPEQIKENIIADLIKDGIIADRKSPMMVRLTQKELVVNKKLQSPELHQKYSKKYIKFAPENSAGERIFDFIYQQ